MKVLVVEDDPTLRQALLRLLAQWGYGAEAADTVAEGLAWLERDLFDLVLLDLGLPDADGQTLCRTLRRSGRHQPLVMILTARDSSASKVAGLESGADDYVVKPFEPMVLRAKLQALLRRAHHPLVTTFRCGALCLRSGDTTLMVGGRGLELTRKEALLLERLLRADGGCCSKAELLHACGDGRREVGEDALRAHMRNLRQKLMAAGCAANLIETVYGLGYRVNPTAAA